ncbi:hypothetical protein SLS56_008596 [Neofusicoccum ribis]|uniref:Major facilitator superfamily (MFS) profile domain-containing protein n=1 Tax=Neofusicoccum ribis TaxID=45134 RepID=A0ABR3SJK9_9PEZI
MSAASPVLLPFVEEALRYLTMNNNDSPKRNPTDEEMRLIVAPFARWNTETMNHEISEFIREAGLQYDEESIRRGAKLAQDENAFKRPRDALEYRDNEEEYLRSEAEGTGRDKFKQTWTLYSLVFVCSIGAAVQGWDESAVSSAQIYFQLNHPLNKLFGRRGTIFIACFVSFVTCLGQGFVQTWQQLFVARLLLGFGIGPKSATIPVFAAECAPANIRGALVMMWQMWTAAGIMFGYVAGVALHAISDGSDDKCHALGYYSYNYNGSVNSTTQSGVLPPRPPAIDPTNIHLKNVTNTEDLLGTNCSLNWRMMLAAPAARDLFLIHHLLKNEKEIFGKQNGLKQLFTQPRSRRALLASVIVMFLQQLCGVNETKDLTLEELDKVFSLKTSKHMAHGIRQFNWFVKRYLLWQRFAEKPILVHPGEHPEEADIFEVGSNLDRSSIGGSEVGLEVMELRRI